MGEEYIKSLEALDDIGEGTQAPDKWPPREWLLSEVRIDPHDIHVPHLDRLLFCNDNAFNEITIRFRSPVQFINLSDTIALTGAHELGIVLTCDRYGDGEPGGFHSHFVPWSNILMIHQYIGT